MRSALAAAAAALVLIGTVGEAEARGRRFGLGIGRSWAGTPRGETVRAEGGSRRVRTAGAEAGDSLRGSLPDSAAVPASPPAPAPSPRVTKNSGSWCAAGRLAGSGTGFCLVN